MKRSVVVYQRSGRWAARLRRELDSTAIPVVATGRSTDALATIEAAPGSALVIEMDDPADTWPADLELVRQSRQRGSDCIVVAVAPPAAQHLECALREFGAVHVCFDPLEWDPIVQIIRKHFDHQQAVRGTGTDLETIEGIIDG